MAQLIESAFADAELLLIHAVREGMEVPQSLVDDIVQTQSLMEGGGMNDVQKARFWNAFGALARLVCPVTVASLRATTDTMRPSRNRLYAFLQQLGILNASSSLARRAVLSYTVTTVFCAALLLVVQVYWLFGVTLTTDIVEVKAKLLDNRSKIIHTNMERDQIRASGGKGVRTEAEVNFDLKQLDESRQDLVLSMDASSEMLHTWSLPWDGTWNIHDTCASASDGQSTRLDQCERSTRLQAAEVVLENLQRYALPLMYGLLGACVFTLRTLANQIRARAYSESARIDFRIRLCLGTLGGLISAWFLMPGTAGTSDPLSSNISPFALAFLSGYSIELVFAAMDRIIGAFTSKA